METCMFFFCYVWHLATQVSYTILHKFSYMYGMQRQLNACMEYLDTKLQYRNTQSIQVNISISQVYRRRRI